MKTGFEGRRSGALTLGLAMLALVGPGCGSEGEGGAGDGQAGERSLAGAPGSGAASSGGEGSGATSNGGASEGGKTGSGASGGTTDEEKDFLPLFESGSRLKAIYLTGEEDDAGRFVTWYDTKLKVECVFGLATDGEYRCLPRDPGLSQGFLDEACSEPVYYDARPTPCDGEPAFWVDPIDSVSRCGGRRVMRLEPAKGVDTVYRDEDCPTSPREIDDGATVWREAGVVDPEEMVRADWIQRAGPDGVGIGEYLADDGSRQVTGIFDAKHGSCSPREMTEGDVRCVGSRAFYEADWWWSGEGCTGTPLAYGNRLDDCAEPAEYAIAVISGEKVTYSVVRLGDPVEGTAYELSLSDKKTCTPSDTEDLPWTLYPVEEAYDVSNFFAVKSATLGSGRVRTFHNRIDDHILTYKTGKNVSYAFYDEELDEPCEAYRSAEGGWICLPERVRRITNWYFADDECSEPLLVVQEPAEVPETIAYVRNVSCTRDSYASEVHGTYAVADRYEGPQYRMSSEYGCRLLEYPVAELVPYELEPIDEFARLQEVRD